MSQSIIHNPDGKTRRSDNEITPMAHAESSKWIGLCRLWVATLWGRFWVDIDSRCYPVEPKPTSPNPFTPTSLKSKQVADIWLLNSKL